MTITRRRLLLAVALLALLWPCCGMFQPAAVQRGLLRLQPRYIASTGREYPASYSQSTRNDVLAGFAPDISVISERTLRRRARRFADYGSACGGARRKASAHIELTKRCLFAPLPVVVAFLPAHSRIEGGFSGVQSQNHPQVP